MPTCVPQIDVWGSGVMWTQNLIIIDRVFLIDDYVTKQTRPEFNMFLRLMINYTKCFMCFEVDRSIYCLIKCKHTGVLALRDSVVYGCHMQY